MITRLSSLIALLLIPFGSQGQLMAAKPQLSASVMRATTISMYDVLNFPEDEQILGSPYLNDAYSKGALATSVGKFQNVDMRFNVYLDQIEFKERDSVFSLQAIPDVHSITVGDRTFIVDHVTVKGKEYTAFFIRLDSGATSLLMRPTIILKPKAEAKPMTDPTPAEFLRKQDVFYVKVTSGQPKEISNIKSLIAHLPDHKKEMESFAKGNDISTKVEDDLIKFIKYYNSL